MNISQNQLKIITAYIPDNMRKYEKILRKEALLLIFKEKYLVFFFQKPLVTEGNILIGRAVTALFISLVNFYYLYNQPDWKYIDQSHET